MNAASPSGDGPVDMIATAKRDHAQRIAVVDDLVADTAAVRGAYDCGYTVGYGAGRLAGLDEAAARLRAAQHDLSRAADWRALAADPSHRRLAELRRPDDSPCRPGGCGRCSRCVRAAAVARQGGDFLGTSRVDDRGAA